MSETTQWYTYILLCADGSLYTGITTDLSRRVSEHNGQDGKGARYTRTRQPVTLAYSENCADRSTASKREAQIKKLPTVKKWALVKTM